MSEKVRRLQVNAHTLIIKNLRPGATQIGCLREAMKQKERAIKGLFDVLEGHILPLRHCGLSVISIYQIGEELINEIKMQSSIMEQYASRLSAIMPDLAKSYNGVSSRITSEADRIFAPVREEAEKAVKNPKLTEAQEFLALI